MAGFQVKRNSPGSYDVGAGGFDRMSHYVVHITYRPDLKGWIAAAQWDRFLYTDPVSTYREAKHCATSMLVDIAASEAKRLEEKCL